MIVARIVTYDDNVMHTFRASNEKEIADFLAAKYGTLMADNGIPMYVEASSWCSVACIGDTFSNEWFEISIEDTDLEKEPETDGVDL